MAVLACRRPSSKHVEILSFWPRNRLQQPPTFIKPTREHQEQPSMTVNRHEDHAESLHGHIDAILDALAARERRAVMAYFLETDNRTATVSELASQCQQPRPSDESTVTVDRMTARLHHRHLPKLADAGIIEYEPQTQVVQYQEAPMIEELFRTLCEHSHDLRR